MCFKCRHRNTGDHNEAVVYKGPFSKVVDDDGHVFERGERIAVCRKTFGILTSEAYQDQFHPVLPLKEILEVDRKEFAALVV